MPIIKFHSNRMYNAINSKYYPVSAKEVIPKWYSGASKYEKDINGDPVLNYLGGKLFTYKACPALLDLFLSGYFLTTPCDLTFYRDENQKYNVKTEKGYEDFCGPRPAMKDFEVPYGHMKEHFHWYPNWAPRLPEGYSALYVSPLNRFDLPFITVAGIIDNDKMDTPGLIPFFLKEGFEGVIPAGTPYVQILPFKREDWEMQIKHHNYQEILKRHQDQAQLYRTKDGGQYKKFTWSRKKYE